MAWGMCRSPRIDDEKQTARKHRTQDRPYGVGDKGSRATGFPAWGKHEDM